MMLPQNFLTLAFNFSTEVYQCIHEYKELEKYLQKITLIFYFSSKIHLLENEDLNHNSTNIWQIENNKTSKTTIRMDIATHSGEIFNYLDTVIHPGIIINSVHNKHYMDRLNTGHFKYKLGTHEYIKNDNQ